MKIFEAVVILVAGVVFAWWQLRDVRLAQQRTAREKAIRDAQHLQEAPPQEPQ
jgi:hypothetical protein